MTTMTTMTEQTPEFGDALAHARALVSQASEAVSIRTAPTRQNAATLWSLIRTTRKAVEAEQDMVCGPLKATYEQTRAPYLEMRKECELWESRLQKAMGEWDREQGRLARIEQERLQAKVDAQNEKIIEKAEAKGIEPVLRVATVVQTPPRSIETAAGTTQTRSVKQVYTPTNLVSLMRDFPQIFVLDLPKFNALAKAGMLDGRDDVAITQEFIYSQRG